MAHSAIYDWLLSAEEDANKYEDYNVRLAARIMKDYYEGAESETVVAYCAKEKNSNKIQFFTYSEEQCLQNIQKYPNLECVQLIGSNFKRVYDKL